MDQEDNQYEMPIPTYAMGTRILLIDADISSLMHTTSVLEQATYRVTSTELPDVALTMLQERANEYDIVMAAVEMRGMDCLTFLRRVKILSGTPVVLMSYKKDEQLAIKVLQEGVCQLFVKPIGRNNLRSLWQYAIRKKRNITADTEPINAETEQLVADPKGKQVVSYAEKSEDPKNGPKRKGKEKIMVDSKKTQEHKFLITELTIIGEDCVRVKENMDTHKRKRPDDNNKEKGKSCAQTSNRANKGPKTDKGKKKGVGAWKGKKKNVKWNAELHAKFMKVLMMDSGEAQRPVQQASGTQAVTNPQNPKEQPHHPAIKTAAPIRSTADSSEGKQQPQMEGRHRSGGSNSGKAPQVRATHMPSFNPRAHFPVTSGFNLGKQVIQTGITKEGSSMSRTLLLHNTNAQFGVKEIANKNANSFGSGACFPSLKGRIEQIRRAYRTSSRSGKTATSSNIEASLEPLAQGTDDLYQKGNQVADAMRFEILESMPLCGKRSWSQFENFSTGDIGNASEMLVGQVNMLGGNMAPSYGHNWSNFSSMNIAGFSPLQNVFLPNPTINAPSYITSENYPSPFMQNYCDPQREMTGLFTDPTFPVYGTMNNYLLGSSGPNQEFNVVQQMSSETGLPNQIEKLMNDFSEKTLGEFVDINPSGRFLSTGASSSQQPTEDDCFFDAILAELQADFGDGNLKSIDFNTKM